MGVLLVQLVLNGQPETARKVRNNTFDDHLYSVYENRWSNQRHSSSVLVYSRTCVHASRIINSQAKTTLNKATKLGGWNYSSSWLRRGSSVYFALENRFNLLVILLKIGPREVVISLQTC